MNGSLHGFPLEYITGVIDLHPRKEVLAPPISAIDWSGISVLISGLRSMANGQFFIGVADS
jgi:hypothetical protein